MLRKEIFVDAKNARKAVAYGIVPMACFPKPMGCEDLEYFLRITPPTPRLCGQSISFSQLMRVKENTLDRYSVRCAVVSMAELGFPSGGSLRELVGKVSEGGGEFALFGSADSFFGHVFPIEEDGDQVVMPITRDSLRYSPDSFYTVEDQRKRRESGLPDFDKSILERFYAVITRKRMPSRIVTHFHIRLEEPGDAELRLGPEEKILLKVKK
ncbi:MAG: hypothetical protein WCJ29_00755 [bacterium]